jgi:hypothetical protein
MLRINKTDVMPFGARSGKKIFALKLYSENSNKQIEIIKKIIVVKYIILSIVEIIPFMACLNKSKTEFFDFPNFLFNLLK